MIDKDGMAVSLTQTINVPFGSGLVVPGTGVLLNNEMDDFYLKDPIRSVSSETSSTLRLLGKGRSRA